MKKSVIFLINGLGIEKAGSYSISIDQCMPNLSKTKETSYFTTAFISSLEYRSAYERFFLGDTYQKEVQYIDESIINENIGMNPAYQALATKIKEPTNKLHVFVEPTNDKIAEEINKLVNSLNLDEKKEVYLHLLLTQQTVSEYQKLTDIVNYIKYHLNTRITVGFIIGKEWFNDNMTNEELDIAKKLFFYCSAERWSDTEKKFQALKEMNIRPCVAPGFCATNSCAIQDNDVILFFNTRRTSYDKFIKAIYSNAESVFKTSEYSLPIYSLIQLDSTYNIPCFSQNIKYEDCLSNLLGKVQKKALILTKEENINLVNFLSNGLNYVNNPSIQFMKLDDNYLNRMENVQNLIDNTDYDLIILDYHMDVSKTINDLKEQLSKIDIVLGNVAASCVNKHSLFITSLYGMKKTLPLAEYNAEEVTIDYEMQIPIFFFDYSYPRSKYTLFPGETHDILCSAIKCTSPEADLYSLVRQKGLINNLIGALIKK